ncbi:MAG TPA: hypothetical protein VL947_11920, partial [Cytophagales bacterium]|nr:hypothetical protein [Cytophagales bacterium]
MIYISLSSKSLKVALWLSIFIVCSVQNLNAQCQALPVTNLVTNGSFSAANTGFISGYRNCTDPNCLYPEGRYSIGRTADYFHDNFVGRDHTTGSGNFMIINGAGAPNTIVWSQKITVKPGVNYNFSSWVSSLNVRSPAKLQFQINGQTIGDIFSAPANLRNWQEFFVTWNSGTADTARITILNQNNDLGGNDFGLDDISFKEICPTKQPLLGPDISICGMGTLDLSSN